MSRGIVFRLYHTGTLSYRNSEEQLKYSSAIHRSSGEQSAPLILPLSSLESRCFYVQQTL